MSKKAASSPETPAAAPAPAVPSVILVIDDEKDVHYSFERLLASDTVTVLSAESGDEGLKILKQRPADVVVMDIRMGAQNGLDTLKQIRQISTQQVVVMMTAYGTSQTAIEAMKLGAYDYILKPFDIPQLKELLGRALEAARAIKTDNAPIQPKPSPMDTHPIVGNAAAMQRVYKTIGQVAPTNATVLITGESGTGKEVVARSIFQNSPRNNRLFIPINCVAIPENLLESELFGHERGAFTGAMAQRIGKFELGDGGTIFLDEIGDMPVGTQTKLLRVLQEGEFNRLGNNEPIKTDVRIIAATNKNLAEAVKNKEFREDLYYRLNVVNLHLPRLAERPSDIPLLVNFFLHKHRQKHAGGPVHVTPEAMECLQAYSWPGNVRELENVIQRAMVFANASSIQVVHLPEWVAAAGNRVAVTTTADPAELFEPVMSQFLALARRDDRLSLSRFEQELARRALVESRGDEEAAAELLGLSAAEFKKLSGKPAKK
ncbi:MAG: sigma-54 dependent transcriptional regulator [Verrucomicrobium sp.]|nr:sigma-54 dependent transcriptional regulator [Verrucomicrobium sp.]